MAFSVRNNTIFLSLINSDSLTESPYLLERERERERERE